MEKSNFLLILVAVCAFVFSLSLTTQAYNDTDYQKVITAPHWCPGGNLAGADFTGKDLPGANLSGANLQGAVLKNTKLNPYIDPETKKVTVSNLSGAHLDPYIDKKTHKATMTNLSGADLSNANLTSAVLTGANLGGAKLNGADLTSATLYPYIAPSGNTIPMNFTGANLTNAILDGIHGNAYSQDYHAQIAFNNTTLAGTKFTNIKFAIGWFDPLSVKTINKNTDFTGSTNYSRVFWANKLYTAGSVPERWKQDPSTNI